MGRGGLWCYGKGWLVMLWEGVACDVMGRGGL